MPNVPALSEKPAAKSDMRKQWSRRIKIWHLFWNRGKINVAQGMELLSLSKSRTSQILNSMVQDERLIKEGIGKAACYKRGAGLQG